MVLLNGLLPQRKQERLIRSLAASGIDWELLSLNWMHFVT
jgi:hypothetical protein